MNIKHKTNFISFLYSFDLPAGNGSDLYVFRQSYHSNIFGSHAHSLDIKTKQQKFILS